MSIAHTTGALAGSRIVVLNGNHLCHNPRVIKEADALAQEGADVEVLGAWLDEDLAQRDRALASVQRFRYRPVFSMTDAKHWPSVAKRARRRAGFEAIRLLGLETPDALGYGLRAMRRAALEAPADLYIAHSESMLWVARELRGRGRRVGLDMEDWFSEDLLPDMRSVRPVALLRSLEGDALRTDPHRTCTSDAMGAALAAAYGCTPPVTIYNAFAWSERESLEPTRRDRTSADVSLHWFSQSMGPGRGLEDLMAALQMLDMPTEVHLRGFVAPDYRARLEALAPPHCQMRFHPIVSNAELLSRIAEHDVGLSLDPVHPESRNVTVTNKILQYLQAGLAVVASNTAGNREVAARAPRAVRLYAPGDPQQLADRLRALLSSRSELAAAKAASLEAAEKTFSWERVAPRLVASVEQALVARP